MTVRVVIADDSVLLREGVARLLGEAGIEVVAQAGDGFELLEATRRHRPDVAIVDIRMPPSHTDERLRAAEAIRAEHGTSAVSSSSRSTSRRHSPFVWSPTGPVAWATFPRTASTTSTTSPTPSAGSRRAAP